ncbi:MAG: hypothetical protein ABFC77_00445 [Thermoguttaceae bacterium]
MKLLTFRAATMHEALARIRRELGPEAALLGARRVRPRWLGVVPGRPMVEVTAGQGVHVPCRWPVQEKNS